jgi:hypothetical protein
METAESQAVYRRRGGVAEFPNAWIKEKLGVRKFRVRGVVKGRDRVAMGLPDVQHHAMGAVELAADREGVKALDVRAERALKLLGKRDLGISQVRNPPHGSLRRVGPARLIADNNQVTAASIKLRRRDGGIRRSLDGSEFFLGFCTSVSLERHNIPRSKTWSARAMEQSRS